MRERERETNKFYEKEREILRERGERQRHFKRKRGRERE